MYDAINKFQQKNYTDMCFQKTIQKSENKRKERERERGEVNQKILYFK